MTVVVKPMLAQLARELPVGDYLYEPKWDGFRALAHRDGPAVDLRSRHGRPLARYFPELVDALRQVAASRFVIDGEIVPEAASDFASLMLRLHPASTRVERLSVETPARLIAFDLVACDGVDLQEVPFVDRRAALEHLLVDAPDRIALSPITDDAAVATGWLRSPTPGTDGIVAKERALTYQPGKRAMVKVKRERTADCVVAGFRVLAGIPRVGSLLLGLYDADDALRHVGVTASFSEQRRRELLADLHPLITSIDEHPWRDGFGLERSPTGRLAGSAGRWDPGMSMDWVPVRPALVAEVAFDALDGRRFRHPAKFRRWRPDRSPRSCTFEQFDNVVASVA